MVPIRNFSGIKWLNGTEHHHPASPSTTSNKFRGIKLATWRYRKKEPQVALLTHSQLPLCHGGYTRISENSEDNQSTNPGKLAKRAFKKEAK